MKPMSEWNDADRNAIASSLRLIADVLRYKGISEASVQYVLSLALAIDNA